MYLPKTGKAFLHCPKTGGKFVRTVVRRLNIQNEEHANEIGGVEELMKWKGCCPYFTFVRHPAEWIRSYWADRIINGWGGDLIIAHRCASNDFNRFVERVCLRYPGFIGDLYDRYQSLPEYFGEGIETYKYEELVPGIVKGLKGHRVGKELLHSFVRVNRCATLPDLADRCRYAPEIYNLVCDTEEKIMTQYKYVRMNPIK